MPSCAERVQGAFYRTFYQWGHLVARRPFTVILCSALLSIVCGSHVFWGQPLPQEVEQEKLWVPQQAESVDDKRAYDRLYGRQLRRNTFTFTTSPAGGNVLTTDVLSEVARFIDVATGQVYAWKGEDGALSVGNVSYASLCARAGLTGANHSATSSGDCQLFGHPLELWRSSGGGYDLAYTDAQILATVNLGKGVDSTLFPPDSDRTVRAESVFGGLEYDSSGSITKAKAIQLVLTLADYAATTDNRTAAEAWEDQLNLLVGSEWTQSDLSQGSVSLSHVPTFSSTKVEVYPDTQGGISREFGRTIRGDLVAIQISYFIIFIYAAYIFGRTTVVQSRALLAVSGVVAVGLSVLVAYGLTTALGEPLNPVVNVLPFILIGIGVDDMFVMIFALEATPHDLPVPERMAQAMGSAGVSITITSITDLFAFLLGATSQLPALSGFCKFAAVGILFDYLMQISFFAGWMALDVYRENKNKVDCCPCLITAPKETTGCCCLPFTYGKCAGLQSYGLRPWLKKYFIPTMRSKGTKGAIIVGFVVLTSVMSYGASQLKQNFDRKWFVNDDAKLQDAWAVQDTYFLTGTPVYFVTPPSSEVDYHTVGGQTKLAGLATAVGANEWIETGSYSSWYASYRDWVRACGEATTNSSGVSCVRRDCEQIYDGGEVRKLYPYCTYAKSSGATESLVLDGATVSVELPGSADPKSVVDADGSTVADGYLPSSTSASQYVLPAKFFEWLDQFVVDSPVGAAYAAELRWASTADVRTAAQAADGVEATRTRARYKYIEEALDQVKAMKSLRSSVGGVGFGSTFPFTFAFLFYEQYDIIIREAITNLSLAFAAVVVITLLIVADVRATLLVALMIILVDVDILGLIHFWGLTIDSVSVINLVLAIGLALDYSVHIAHAFLQTPGTRQERIDRALEQMGTPVIHGAFSTFLAVVVLSISKSYVFRIFFKMFFGIVVFGAAHGLLLLPVLLSWVGPEYVDTQRAADVNGKGSAEVMPKSTTSAEMVAVPAVSATPSSPPPAISPTSAPPSPPGMSPTSARSSRSSSPSWTDMFVPRTV